MIDDAASGQARWNFATSGPVRATPVYRAGTLYVASGDGRLYALDATNGQQRWAHSIDESKVDQLLSDPIVTEDAIYLAAMSGKVVALDPANGNQRWSVSPGLAK